MSEDGAAIVEIVTRCDDKRVLDAIAEELVGSRVAACAHVRGTVESTYRWRGEIVRANEWELDAVLCRRNIDTAVALIQLAHSYETPAVITRAVSCDAGYAAWVRESTTAFE